MALSALGVGSGLDVNNILTQLMAIERMPQQRLMNQQKTIESQISALGRVKSVLDNFKTASAALSKAENLYSFKGELSDASVARVTGGAGAVAGNYRLEISKLATHHKVASDPGFAPPSTSGTLEIQFGSNTPISIALDAGASLNDVRDAINSAKAGVSATIINGDDGPQLMISSDESGAAKQFTVTGTGGFSSLNFETKETAQDAELKIDNIAITSASNTVKDAITGITLELTATTSAPVSLKVTNDTAPLKEKMEAFVKAYNDVRSTIGELTKFDAANKTAGVLNGDSTVSTVLNQMRNVLTGRHDGVSGAFPTLVSLGISSNADGTLVFNESVFNSATASDFAGVAQTLSTYTAAFEKAVDGLTSTNGVIANRTNGLTATNKSLTDRMESMERLLKQVEDRYRKQFTALDSLMGRLQSTSNYLMSQLSSLQKGWS